MFPRFWNRFRQYGNELEKTRGVNATMKWSLDIRLQFCSGIHYSLPSTVKVSDKKNITNKYIILIYLQTTVLVSLLMILCMVTRSKKLRIRKE